MSRARNRAGWPGVRTSDGQAIRAEPAGHTSPAGRIRSPGPVVEVTCWCERRYLRVPLDRVAAGLTESCGHRECKQPNQEG